MIGEVVLLGHKYFVGRQAVALHCALYDQIIPGDIVDISNDGVVRSIQCRRPIVTVGIIQGVCIEGSEAFIHCPLVSPHFRPKVAVSKCLIGDRLLIRVSQEAITSIRHLGSIWNRSQDGSCLVALLEHTKAPNLRIQSFQSSCYNKAHTDLTKMYTFTLGELPARIAMSTEGTKVYIHTPDIHAYMPHGCKEDLDALQQGCNFVAKGMVPTAMAKDCLNFYKGCEPRSAITVEMDMGSKDVDFSIYPSTVTIDAHFSYDEAMACPNLKFMRTVVQNRRKWPLSTVPKIKLSMHQNHETLDVGVDLRNTEGHVIEDTFRTWANVLMSEHIKRNLTDMYEAIPSALHNRIIFNCKKNPNIADNVVVNSYMRKFITKKAEIEHCYVPGIDPLGRYLEVMVQRMIAGVKYNTDDLRAVYDHIGRQEKMVSTMEALFDKWKVMSYMVKVKGQPLDAYVTRVCPAGIYYVVPSCLWTGFVHVSAIKPSGAVERWKFTPDFCLVGDVHSVRQGSKLRIVIHNVDFITGDAEAEVVGCTSYKK